MNHINAVIDGFDRTVSHLGDVYGAQLVADMPKDEWHACLIVIGGVIFELFAPHDDLLHARIGPHYIGVEYQVPDVERARREVTARGLRIVRELGAAFHLHPLDAFGVALEFYDRSFHDDPPPAPFLEPIRPAAFWRDEHPLGISGLKRYSVAVADAAAATDFFAGLVGAQVLYQAERPAVVARAVGLQLGDTVVELLAPDGDGPAAGHVARWGDGIRSVVFAVADLARAERYLAGRGLRVDRGDAPDALAVVGDVGCGLRFEFAEADAADRL